MKPHIFKIECLTDMHVGNGEANYNIIDNEVQKDTVLQDVPIIQSSGVKGALKQHFEGIWGKESKYTKQVFGGEIETTDADGSKKKTTKEGAYKFFTAVCLARPLRVSDGEKPYVLATSYDVLDSFKSLLDGLKLKSGYENLIGSFFDGDKVEVEGKPTVLKKTSSKKSIFKEDFVVFNSLQDFALPVRARNFLDDGGISKNLWYEELVPHKSIFYFAILVPDDDQLFAEFKEKLEASPVQFGGNASVGNGYTTVTEVEV
ncbi:MULTISPECIES: type III-B CRISPR module RAMP protein Cmr4 [Caproicibacterium]|uniref:Type III-B CRISPR module RAMP protein Cmr4 n=1 Tax=Caproicibacterium argilliputei TaxID=3030016 RepID=A0AA97D7S9_9FIRM|nr:type III-B CRISPR module RAMP protein Cmr4 [Caproicibacterium argilliputei]WOC31811.1 type III-B CRISPR module RAMP protein Cmr4 [Caproicibacterium argilliputei]